LLDEQGHKQVPDETLRGRVKRVAADLGILRWRKRQHDHCVCVTCNEKNTRLMAIASDIVTIKRHSIRRRRANWMGLGDGPAAADRRPARPFAPLQINDGQVEQKMDVRADAPAAPPATSSRPSQDSRGTEG
jgi:hypothetical protein